ncbi:hypothetical protein ABZ876_17860 [Streptomyces sp. NPDC046931]|uniref:hypothetical protein n=1 Tax=Streptomyces sp. NPDC046931 TaxID=3154806 RepID=UPI0033D8C030
MGTAERRGTPGSGGAAPKTARGEAQGADRGFPARAAREEARERGTAVPGDSPLGERGVPAHEEFHEAPYRPLWVEEPARRRRLPDPVRTAAVRAVLVISVTLIQAVVAFLCTMADSWLAFPMVLSSVASTVVATWGVLDVWVTRQVWYQRHGVVSAPSSTARELRRERRTVRRQARAAERTRRRIRRQGGAGQLSHP